MNTDYFLASESEAASAAEPGHLTQFRHELMKRIGLTKLASLWSLLKLGTAAEGLDAFDEPVRFDEDTGLEVQRIPPRLVSALAELERREGPIAAAWGDNEELRVDRMGADHAQYVLRQLTGIAHEATPSHGLYLLIAP